MSRPASVVHVWDLPGEKRPRFTNTAGVGSVVRNLGDTVGLTHMGVHLRVVEPGLAGTNRHFHFVEEEWGWVVSGQGAVRIGPHRLAVRAGTFAGFPPGPRPHHFLAEGTEPLVVLEGGERRRAEDHGWYVDLGKTFRFASGTASFQDAPGPPPPEQGDPAQCVHIDELPVKQGRISVGEPVPDQPHYGRSLRVLHTPTGLARQAVYWARLDAGATSTSFHTHTRNDEWVFILAGRAAARFGDERYEVGPHDFLGFPAGCPAHTMSAIEPLTYLLGGEIDLEDVVIYPERGERRVAGRIEPLG